MDVSVIIVNWNVKPLLRSCLASVMRQRGVAFEVIVVDNASWDGSSGMVATEFPDAMLIANTRNMGFAAANNEAIAHAQGRHVLLLNPDTEFADDTSLAAMVQYMDEHPEVGILGPRLRNTDRTVQPSVRAFPTFMSQALIMLKLHHLFRHVGPLRRYFADGFEDTASADVDQVMGACFLINGNVIEKIGKLDDGFFIWFEEVDFCKRAVDAGYRVRYAPIVDVVHHGGESFAQVFSLEKQQAFNASLRRYARKHLGMMASVVLTALHPFSLALAWLVASVRNEQRSDTGSARTLRDTFRTAVLFITLFEVLSFVGFLLPWFSTATFLVTIALAVVLAVSRFEDAVLVLLAELFIGSQGGYLVSAGAGSGLNLSLRIGLFLTVFTVWAGRLGASFLTRARRAEAAEAFVVPWRDGVLLPYLALLAVFAVGFVRGALGSNEFSNVFFDANGYAYFALLPLLYPLFRSKEMRTRTLAVLTAAMTVAVGKALFVLYIFSHRVFMIASPLYIWIRDTRVGEITIMVGDFYRIFFQSHVFVLVSAFGVLLLLAFAPTGSAKRTRFLFLAWLLVGLLMGLSRSFWFGGFAAFVAMCGLYIKVGTSQKVWMRSLGLGAAAVGIALLMIAAVYVFPFPQQGEDVSFGSIFGSRAFSVAGEAAANSRWALLPILDAKGLEHPFVGSGLGTTVTYTTSDPRLLADNPTGEYTTFAFEWGYHDLWVKFGFVGLAVYAWFLFVIIRPLFGIISRHREALRFDGPLEGTKKTALLAAGILIGVVALLATNVFSPYLNHPLGIGFLMLVAGFASALAREDQPSEEPATVA